MCAQRTNNILSVYHAALPELPGVTWYEEAHQWAVDTAARLGYTVRQVVGATAAVSPQQSWETNKLMVEELDWSRAYGTNRAKADLIVGGAEPTEVLCGPKVRAFYDAILTPDEWHDAVIDRHAIGIWLGRVPTQEERNRYGRHTFKVHVQADYAHAAWKVGLYPHQLQAATWVEWRNKDVD